MNTQYSGTVSRSFFAAPDGPAMAGVLTLDDGSSMRFKGKCFAEVGDKLAVEGKWFNDPKFGRQFLVESGVVKMDDSPDAISSLIAAHEDFKGLGPVRARQVVDAALSLSGNGDAIEALICFPDEIAARSKVSVDVVINAAEVLGARKSYFAALAALCDQGWSSAQATRIVTRFGENAAKLVEGDPYMLIGKVSRFGFRTVDTVARKMGVESTDPMRLQCGVAFCLDRIAGDGNTYTTREALVDESVGELRPDTLDGEDRIREAIENLIAVGLITVETSPTGIELVADAQTARAEIEVFRILYDGLSDESLSIVSLDGKRAKGATGGLNKGQAEAVAGFATNRFGVISGGAGVGKTYTMDAICEIAAEGRLRVELCAPTGKAARKLAHATGRIAKTIHRLLEPQLDPSTGEFVFTRHGGNPIEADLVIVDEVSMVDVRLMRSLLIALPKKCRLLLVGDHHQIPSVGPGAILRDLLAARDNYASAVHVLTEIVRQAGVLAKNTTAILDGIVEPLITDPWALRKFKKGDELEAAVSVAILVEKIVTAPKPIKPFARLLDFAWDVQVLAPQRKGPLGTYALNVHLQKLRQRLMNNPAPEPTPANKPPKPLVGDRVIWTKNDYDLDLFNGTQAIVTGLPKGGTMEIFTEDGREVKVPGNKRVNVEVAYAMTIHKAQGSEWPCIILIASSSHWNMHDRNLLYTGASRASEALRIMGDGAGVKNFAATRRSAVRKTFGALIAHGWQPAA